MLKDIKRRTKFQYPSVPSRAYETKSWNVQTTLHTLQQMMCLS